MHQAFIGKPLEGFAEFSMTVAAQGAVLLKNRPRTLPLDELDTIAILAVPKSITIAAARGPAGR